MDQPVILVTGSSRGIGAAIVEVLRARGAQVSLPRQPRLR